MKEWSAGFPTFQKEEDGVVWIYIELALFIFGLFIVQSRFYGFSFRLSNDGANLF